MASVPTTTSTLDDLFVNIVAQARFTAEEQSLLRNLVTLYNIEGTPGKTVQVPKYPTITAAGLTEGTDMEAGAVSTSSITVTVGEVGASVLLTDMAAMGAGDPATELGVVLGSAIATKMDKDIIALFDGFSSSLGSAGTEITVADMFKAAATLRANKVRGRIAAVLHPYQAYALKANLTNTFANPNAGDLQNEAMRNGYVGTIAGIDIFESANLTIDANGDTKGAVFAPEAIALAMKRDFRIEPQRDASNRAWELNATAIYGVGELDDSYGVEMFFDAAL
jgi:N4-gp56 family major capsid protein